MHYYDNDPIYPAVRYAWDWKRRVWLAVLGGLVIIAEAAHAERVVIAAHNWMDAN